MDVRGHRAHLAPLTVVGPPLHTDVPGHRHHRAFLYSTEWDLPLTSLARALGDSVLLLLGFCLIHLCLYDLLDDIPAELLPQIAGRTLYHIQLDRFGLAQKTLVQHLAPVIHHTIDPLFHLGRPVILCRQRLLVCAQVRILHGPLLGNLMAPIQRSESLLRRNAGVHLLFLNSRAGRVK